MCTIIALRRKKHTHTQREGERERYYNKWNVQNGLRLRLRNHRKFLKWISENQERSMGDNISWSNLPWPVRLMRRPCICLQSTGINDTCKTIKRFWWTLNNNNHSSHSWIGNSKNISKTKTIWPGMRLYSVQNEIVTIQDWRSIIFHFYASFFFSPAFAFLLHWFCSCFVERKMAKNDSEADFCCYSPPATPSSKA